MCEIEVLERETEELIERFSVQTQTDVEVRFPKEDLMVAEEIDMVENSDGQCDSSKGSDDSNSRTSKSKRTNSNLEGKEMAIKNLDGARLVDAGNGMFFGTTQLNPEMVEHWLERNKNNRKVSKSKLQEYCDTMLLGQWAINGNTIEFSSRNNLLSGQHRLLAYQKALEENPKIKIFMSVAWGTKDKDKHTLDAGFTQTLVHIFERANKPNARILGGAVRLIWLRCNSFSVAGGKGLRQDVAMGMLKDHPGIEDSCEYVAKLNKKHDGQLATVLQLTYAAALHYLCTDTSNKTKAGKFLDQVASGQGDADEPAIKFRNIVIKANSNVSIKLTRDGKLGIFILAYLAYLEGQKVKRLTLKEGDFPRLGGLDSDEDEMTPEEQEKSSKILKVLKNVSVDLGKDGDVLTNNCEDKKPAKTKKRTSKGFKKGDSVTVDDGTGKEDSIWDGVVVAKDGKNYRVMDGESLDSDGAIYVVESAQVSAA